MLREVVTVSSLTEFKNLDNTLRHMVGFFELSCAGPEAGLDGPCRSFPTQDMTLFYDSKVKYFGDALQNASHFFRHMARVRWDSSHLTLAIWKLDEYF